MAKLDDKIKNTISTLPHKELEKLVLKAATKFPPFADYITVNYVDKELGEVDLFDKAKTDINGLYYKSYRGRAPQLRMAKMLSDCIKRINEFSKICKNKNLEADLLVFVLKEAFAGEPKYLGTCFTVFDYKVALLLKRLITLVTKKLHADYLDDYRAHINTWLSMLHSTSNHIDMVYNMPSKI
ncbi:MAG: hypothetical protein BWY70_00852 [Bacteroidetes bacterium ADurb.Bin408]|nr:MAG: hypothetical protein BWY70_00852 [Bacteroidetes bacterium ADurb.Bin408]